MTAVVGAYDILADACRRGGIVSLVGANFSGRSSVLRAAAGLSEQEGSLGRNEPLRERRAIYVGPEIYNSLSGLALTVADELRIHGMRRAASSFVENLIAISELDVLIERNPFLLSGGEQSCLVLISSMLLSPVLLALDGTLEQLAPDLRRRIIQALGSVSQHSCPIILSDNRLSELDSMVESISVREYAKGNLGGNCLPIGPLCPDAINGFPYRSAQRVVLDNVSFKYPSGPQVLRDTSVVLAPGRPYVLTGKNGTGKSTFAKLLVGILRPTQGKLVLGGSVFTPWLFPGQVVGYHFQNPDLQLFETSVIDEVRGGKHKAKSGSVDPENQADCVLEAFGLTNMAQVHPLGLSFPFVLRKRVALAATLSMQTDWVILDEPTLGQDEVSTRAIAEMVHNLVRLGRGVIVISHSMKLLELLNAEHLSLANGQLSRISKRIKDSTP